MTKHTPESGPQFTIPPTYSYQDFDEKQHRAYWLTEQDRRAGRPAPEYGYSESAWKQAEAEYRRATGEGV